MASSDEDFQFESADEDDMVSVTKKKSLTEQSAAQMEVTSPAQIRGNLEDKEGRKEEVLNKLEEAAKPSADTGAWGWNSLSSVGSSLLNTASSSVSTFTHSVGEGFDKFVETVEYSLGAEDPEEFAKKEYNEVNQAQRGDEVVTEQVTSRKTDAANPGESELDEAHGSWFSDWGIRGISTVVEGTSSAMKKTGSLMQQTTGAVSKTGKNLMSGGLDMLETIGKKTYNVLAEGDHGIKTTIQQGRQKSSLSQLLREAKQDAEMQTKQEEEYIETRRAHFGAQFDDFQGVVQLEALEMLSNQSEGKVQTMLSSLPPESLEALKKELVATKQVFELKDLDEDDEDEEKDHEFDRLMNEYIGQIGLNVTAEKIIHVQEKNRKWVMTCSQEQEEGSARPPKEIHEIAIQSLAEITASAIELFHKVGQLILMEKNVPLSAYKTKAQGLASATRVLCTEVGIMSTKFSQRLNASSAASEEVDFVNASITNVYLEATNSGTYIQDGFQLLLPVLQQSIIESQQQ